MFASVPVRLSKLRATQPAATRSLVVAQRKYRYLNDTDLMNPKLPLPLKLPDDVWKWVRREAGKRRMAVGNYTLELIRRGILDEAADDTVRRVRGAVDGVQPSEVLRQILIVRYTLEAALGPETAQRAEAVACARADAELEKLRRTED